MVPLSTVGVHRAGPPGVADGASLVPEPPEPPPEPPLVGVGAEVADVVVLAGLGVPWLVHAARANPAAATPAALSTTSIRERLMASTSSCLTGRATAASVGRRAAPHDGAVAKAALSVAGWRA
jgi:hypothetical protein